MLHPAEVGLGICASISSRTSVLITHTHEQIPNPISETFLSKQLETKQDSGDKKQK